MSDAPRRPKHPRVLLGVLLVGVLGGVLGGCASPAYYWQAARGQLALWHGAQPLDALLSDHDTPESLRDQLLRARAIRAFASQALDLPDNGSYRKYVDIHRPFVVWNVFATAPLSIEPRQWCFPVAGCVSYRGYFAREDAERYAEELRKQGLDVFVGGVPAYSTLGWFDDPLLSSFIHWPETELARLMFHELAHQVAFAGGDSEFDEGFAVTVEEEGVERWIAHRQDPQLAQRFARAQAMRADFRDLVLRYRARLGETYAAPLTDAEKALRKKALIAELKADYARIKRERWNGFAGYDRWFGQDINNATLASIGIYTQRVPQFQALLQHMDHDLPRFYAEVKRLAKLAPEARHAALEHDVMAVR